MEVHTVMEKSRRKSNPTKIERKANNMAGDGKETSNGRKDSSHSFFKNEIEWEKRRLQRMKHLKCCPRVPNRVLAALAMGDTQGEHKVTCSSDYVFDPKYNSDMSYMSLSEAVERGNQPSDNFLSEHGRVLLLDSNARESEESLEHTCVDSLQLGAGSENGNPYHHQSRSTEERANFENDSFDTDAFLSTAFGVPRETSSVPAISLKHSATPSARLQVVPSASSHHFAESASNNMQIRSHSTVASGTFSRSERSRVSSSEELPISLPRNDQPKCEGSVGNPQGGDNDSQSSARDSDFPKLIKTEACDESPSPGKAVEDKCPPKPKPLSQNLDFSRIGKVEPPDFPEKQSPKTDGSPLINLFHSVDSSFPLPAIIKQAKERTLSLTESQCSRSGFIDLNATKSVAQEHVLRSLQSNHHSQNMGNYSPGSYIVLDSKEKRDRMESRIPEGALSDPSPGHLNPQENADSISGSKSESSSRPGSEFSDNLTVDVINGSVSQEDNGNDRSDDEACVYPKSQGSPSAEFSSPRAATSSKLRAESYPFSSSSPAGKSPVIGASWSNGGKKPDVSTQSHSESHRQGHETEQAKIGYPTYESVYERGSFMLPGRNLGPPYGPPKRVHPDFQHLNAIDLREKGFTRALQDGVLASKIPRSDGNVHLNSKDLPLATSRGPKTKLTSLVAPHQNQSLTLRWSGSRPIQQGRNYLVPRMIGEDNVSNLFDPLEISPNRLSQWTNRDVCRFLEQTDCREYASVFLQQEIDGKTLLVLTEEQISRLLKIKIGPAIKIYTHIANLRNILSQI